MFKNYQNLILQISFRSEFLRNIFPLRYNSESLEIKDLGSGNDLLFKDIKIILGIVITTRK